MLCLLTKLLLANKDISRFVSRRCKVRFEDFASKPIKYTLLLLPQKIAHKSQCLHRDSGHFSLTLSACEFLSPDVYFIRNHEASHSSVAICIHEVKSDLLIVRVEFCGLYQVFFDWQES